MIYNRNKIMENNLNDPKNIAGISNLLRDVDIDSNIDLEELEKEIVQGAQISNNDEINIADQFKKEMDKLSRDFDIENINKDNNDLRVNTYNSPIQSPTNSVKNSPKISSNQIPKYSKYNSPRNSNDERKKDTINWDAYEPDDIQLKQMTNEEKRQKKINTVLSGIDEKENAFNIEKESEEDDKASLLEQIDMLKITLEDDGVDVSGIPNINKNSNIKDLQNVYKILRLKNDRNRYCSFAEELILSGAYGMEYLFDGKREWVGRKPDLTGWGETVKVKLRRMRYETSTFVQSVMQEYNLSSGVRLAFELIPSMFLYSRTRRISQTDNLVSDNQYRDAISHLNSI